MDHDPAAGANVAPAPPTHKTCTKCGISKPLASFPPHKATSDRHCSWCKGCHRIASARKRIPVSTNAPAIVVAYKICRTCGQTKKPTLFPRDKYSLDGHKSRCKACECLSAARWRAENQDKAREVAASWRLRNPESTKAKDARRYEQSPEKVLAKNAKRRATRLRATPPWVDHNAIAEVYAEAVRLTIETGIPYEVDHIVPLKNRRVCGLHVPWNLRAIPASENRSKGNKYPSSNLRR
jgi:hypothetical protein